MAVTLVGEVVNSCDTVTGFNVGNISGDDDFVEGVGAIGLKSSAATSEIYTTTLGATAPYDFTAGELGYHIIMWFNTKTPINSTSGLRIVVGNGTSRGNWYVTPSGFYKGGFITRVINTAKDFDVITAGAWTTTGNPAQLTNITQVGGVFTTITSIMGSFNNVQLDQMTIGLGVRADGGTVGTPNKFETVRSADENTNYWGWWGSSNGAIVAKGKLYIGPATGAATSVFNDTAFSVIFARENVATNFYEIATRGNGTDVTWELGSISSADPSFVRWNLTIDSSTNSFTDTNSVFKGAGTYTFNNSSSLSGTTFIDSTKLIQSGSYLDGCTILTANTTAGEAFITSDIPSRISNCTFEYSAGHAIEITKTGSFTFSGNTFVGYLADNTSGSSIFNNSGGPVTMSIVDASSPTVRNSAGSTTLISADVAVTLTGMKNNTEIRVFDHATSNPQIELAGVEDATDGTSDNRSFTFSLSAGAVVDIVIISLTSENQRIDNFTIPGSATSIPIQQRIDRNYINP